MKYKTLYVSWSIVLIFAGLVIAIASLFVRHIYKNNISATSSQPDVVGITDLPDGGRVLTNTTAGYRIGVAQSWYLEKSAGAGITLYPNYDPNGSVAPECKIMISQLQNPGGIALSDWLKNYFSEDPTADVVQESVAGSQISGQPAIIWSGSENGVSTTLAYIARGDAVYEIAPSSIIKDTDSTSTAAIAQARDACATAFQSLLTTFTFLPQ